MNKFLFDHFLKIGKICLPYFFPTLFFLIALFTLYDYGMNWDGPVHYARGQTHLRYLMTGKEDYKDLPSFCRNEQNLSSIIDAKTGEICDRHRKVRVSEYESELLDFHWARKYDNYGHPVGSDILSSITNQIFYKWLGWVEDIAAYNLYHIFMTFVLAITVAYWAKRTFGLFPSMVSGIIVYLYPLLFAEQHFNVKDPAMASFFTLSILWFWIAFTKKSSKYLILSAIAGGLSFSTKFNFVFAPFILLPWIIVYLITQYKNLHLKGTFQKIIRKIYSKVPKLFLPSLIIYPIIVFAVFFGSWPILWFDPIPNTITVFTYYKDIGGATCTYSIFNFYWFRDCINYLPLSYFFYTIPPISLFFFAVGTVASIKNIKKHNFVTILWLSFFLVTIGRVAFSVSAVYGGLRQIMEFIGPFALIGGLGALAIRNTLVRSISLLSFMKNVSQSVIKLFVSIIILLTFVPIFFEMIQLHPNQNIYMNKFIGGLSGAAKRNFPGYGNTFGNVYLQGVKWLNNHADKNANVALLFGNAQNISRASLRPDLQFQNFYQSGYSQLGEYLILLTMEGLPVYSMQSYKYVNTFLDPVYTIEIDGVPLLMIWKNSKEFLKPGVSLAEKLEPIQASTDDRSLVINISKNAKLKHLDLESINPACKSIILNAQISIEEEKDDLHILPLVINNFTDVQEKNDHNAQIYFFAGEQAYSIRVEDIFHDGCTNDDVTPKVYSFEK